jgi:hypothetical protein
MTATRYAPARLLPLITAAGRAASARPVRSPLLPLLPLLSLLAALMSGCGDDELTPLTDDQMCDEVRGLLSFQALGCTGDQDAASRFGDQVYSQYICLPDMRAQLAPCLKEVKGLGCGVMSAVVEDAAYIHWAGACLTLQDPAAHQATCAVAFAAFLDGVDGYLSGALLSLSDAERAVVSPRISDFIGTLGRYRSLWWPCAGAVAVPQADACISAQRAVPAALLSTVTSPAARVASALAQSPALPSCADLFPPSPIDRAYADTQLVYDVIAVTLPLIDLIPTNGAVAARAGGDDLLAWFTATYAPQPVVDSGVSVIDTETTACFQGLGEALGRPEAVVSVEAFAQAFQRTTCHGRLLAPR